MVGCAFNGCCLKTQLRRFHVFELHLLVTPCTHLHILVADVCLMFWCVGAFSLGRWCDAAHRYGRAAQCVLDLAFCGQLPNQASAPTDDASMQPMLLACKFVHVWLLYACTCACVHVCVRVRVPTGAGCCRPFYSKTQKERRRGGKASKKKVLSLEAPPHLLCNTHTHVLDHSRSNVCTRIDANK